MKKILMAALALTTIATGRAYAGNPEECLLPKKPRPAVQEGGCILPKPPKPKASPEASPRSNDKVRGAPVVFGVRG